MKRKEMEALSVDECHKFHAVAEKSEWFPLLALALTTGMRPSEDLALKWTDLDWRRGTASLCRTIQVAESEWAFDDTKRKRSRRIVKLQNFVLKALQSLKDTVESRREGNYSPALEMIFVSASCFPMNQRTVMRIFMDNYHLGAKAFGIWLLYSKCLGAKIMLSMISFRTSFIIYDSFPQTIDLLA